ncbi:MAG: iron ABC transporter permease [bacterium]|nr:iron ABC transporter permease [bacterium]
MMSTKNKLLCLFVFLFFIVIYLFHDTSTEIMLKLRIPRFLMAIFIGAGLSVSGVVFQALLRNPLAEPYTLGIAGMVVLFVNLNAFLGLPNFLAAMLGVVIAVIIIFGVIRQKKYSITHILLIGIMLNIFSVSVVEFFVNLIEYTHFFSTRAWLMGSLASLPLNWIFPVTLVAIIVIGSIVFFYKEATTLDILSLGEKEAIYLGIDVKKKQSLFFIIASIVSGVCVSYTGIIGFVGLMIPHIMRAMIGPRHRGLILGVSFLGGGYLLISDFLAKNIFYPKELSVGVITGIIGAIFFFYLILKR